MPESLSFLFAESLSPVPELLKDKFHRLVYKGLTHAAKTTSINYIDDFALATWAPIKKENKYTLDVFVDKCSVEIFLNGGKVAMTNLIFPSEPYNRMCFYSKGGSFQVDSFNAYRLGL